MGESLEKTVTTIAELIESCLMKLAEQRTKMESDSSRVSPMGGTSTPMSGRSVRGGAFAFPSVDNDDGMLRPSMMVMGMHDENEDGGDDSSPAARQLSEMMEEIE